MGYPGRALDGLMADRGHDEAAWFAQKRSSRTQARAHGNRLRPHHNFAVAGRVCAQALELDEATQVSRTAHTLPVALPVAACLSLPQPEEIPGGNETKRQQTGDGRSIAEIKRRGRCKRAHGGMSQYSVEAQDWSFNISSINMLCASF